MSEVTNYEAFLEELAREESRGRGDYKAESGSFLGRYQMGPRALEDAGYIKGNIWAGKDGVFDKEDFKNNPEAQERAVRIYHSKLWDSIKNRGLDEFQGEIINGVEITQYGLIAASHLKGTRNVEIYLESSGEDDPEDQNSTKVSSYMKRIFGSGTFSDQSPLPIPKKPNRFPEDNDKNFSLPQRDLEADNPPISQHQGLVQKTPAEEEARTRRMHEVMRTDPRYKARYERLFKDIEQQIRARIF